jgi:beta-phosphoglucomutase-like phosphatase (HAD superfamily)
MKRLCGHGDENFLEYGKYNIAMIKGILWDNDGVLVDTERLFYAANRALFLRHGFALGHGEFFDWFLNDNCGAWHWLAARGCTAAQIDGYRDERNRIYSALLTAGGELTIDGMPRLLARCAGRVPMGIVTSSARDHFELIHGRCDLLRHFQFVVSNEHYARSKPDPEPYLLGLQKLGLPAAECLVIEDSPRGLQAARAAGMRCIVSRSALTAKHPFDGAYRIVDSVGQLGYEIEALLS